MNATVMLPAEWVEPVEHGDPMILIVTGLLLVLIAAWWWLEQHVSLWREERRLARLAGAAYAVGAHVDVIDTDHDTCTNPDCGATICRCRRPVECAGATTLGCGHEGLCWGCRLGCRECAFEAHTEQALAWAAGR